MKNQTPESFIDTSGSPNKTLRPKILLVEDNPLERRFYSQFFSTEGYSVSTASSTAEANDFLAAGEFDLVLCDLMVENQPAGLELLRGAKSDPRTRHIPFIMFTSYPGHCDDLASLNSALRTV